MDSYLCLFLAVWFLRVAGVIAANDDPCAVDQYFQKCVNPKARGSVSFEFKPLFPKALDFVYAFDSETQEEADKQYVPEGSTPAPDSKVAFWLEYPEVNLNPTAHAGDIYASVDEREFHRRPQWRQQWLRWPLGSPVFQKPSSVV
ncbi:hypothetical protein MGYG_02290 [Nannizzia gypsea CBS 118893]|uniref:Uncharacterized protein n=1 Tax=Arthroderma gypseum (strain ATCC MYA-4604 / CBS 118893) TaxID=535722 RepID=E4UQV1_ARTGP|nr:hypothetical protein MGYG_02290 [Nannizzia gypsea CBS 118893]EFQ99277.1 hypothetical protein MGYG_02290 [Nannizzia gypsea CBS 118893]